MRSVECSRLYTDRNMQHGSLSLDPGPGLVLKHRLRPVLSLRSLCLADVEWYPWPVSFMLMRRPLGGGYSGYWYWGVPLSLSITEPGSQELRGPRNGRLKK